MKRMRGKRYRRAGEALSVGGQTNSIVGKGSEPGEKELNKKGIREIRRKGEGI